MKKHSVFFAITAVGFLLSSCSSIIVAKRYHNSGFAISWNGGRGAISAKKKVVSQTQTPSTFAVDKNFSSGAESMPVQDATASTPQNPIGLGESKQQNSEIWLPSGFTITDPISTTDPILRIVEPQRMADHVRLLQPGVRNLGIRNMGVRNRGLPNLGLQNRVMQTTEKQHLLCQKTRISQYRKAKKGWFYSIMSVLLGFMGFIPIVGWVFGLAAIFFGLLGLNSLLEVLALIGIVLGALAVAFALINILAPALSLIIGLLMLVCIAYLIYVCFFQ
ncbi:MAG: hypothetical protein CK532_02855 [Flavobacteriales bacterium]|nr:MAG: hypothetical protein CK532_02855 [Flavobacteriales bacterium]